LDLNLGDLSDNPSGLITDDGLDETVRENGAASPSYTPATLDVSPTHDVPSVAPNSTVNTPTSEAETLSALDRGDQVDVSHVPRRLRKRKIPAEDFGLPGGSRILRSAFSKKYVDYVIYNSKNAINLNDFFDNIRPEITRILNKEIRLKKSIKTNLMLVSNFTSPNTAVIEFGHKTSNFDLLSDLDVESHIDHQIAKLYEDFDSRELRGSGYTQQLIKYLELRISEFKLLPIASYIELPGWIKNKHAVLNPKTKQQDCFKIAILSKHCKGLARSNRPRRLAEFENMYSWDIPMPPTIKDVRKFCRTNGVSINIFGIEKKEIFAMELTKNVKRMHYNLLYLDNDTTAHFCLITSLSGLLSRQATKSKRNKKYFCLRCMLRFNNQQNLNVHIKSCGDEIKCAIKLPTSPKYYKFTNYAACQKMPVIITLDLETIAKPLSGCEPDPKTSFVNNTHQHIPCSFGAYLRCEEDVSDIPDFPLGYFGHVSKNEVLLEDELIEYFEVVAKKVKLLYSRNYPICMSAEDEINCALAKNCYICGKAFSADNIAVKDHNHLRQYSNFRGCACATPCNIQMKKFKFIPVYTHNSASFDSHFYIKYFSAKKFPIKIIPHTSEKYMCISVTINGVEFKILDSYKIFGAGLAAIVDSLPEDAFVETNKNFDAILAPLLRRKGVFCYSFMTKVSRLDYRKFPSKKWFFNDLNNVEIPDEEYERGRQIWNAGMCLSVKDYLEIYQKSDSVQLMDSIIYFRNVIYDKFKLDCCWFLSLAHLGINCFLKLSGVQLEIMQEHMSEAYDLVQRASHGGIAMTVTRFVECVDGIEAFYYDSNSLYGHCMGDYPLPIGEYEFVATDYHDWENVDAFGPFGFILQGTFEFPDEIHDYLADYPPLAERKKPPNCKTYRLICDLTTKKDYPLSLLHFQQILKLGVRCTKISRVLKYRQGKYMSEYVKILSKWRREAVHEVAGLYFKLLLNSCFGKFKEAIFSRRRLICIQSPEQLERLIRKPTFVDRHIFDFQTSKMVLVELSQGSITQTRPTIVGTVILSLAKHVMLFYWYGLIKKTLKNVRLITTDTDSLMGFWKTNNPIDDLKPIKDHFDWSNLPSDHELYSRENAKVFGKLKDETAGNRILAVASPRTKAYSIKFEHKEMKKLKGIKKSYVENEMVFEQYKQCVLEKKTFTAKFKNLVSKKHLVYTASISKLALEATDYKRVVLENGVDTLPYGHYSLN
jgi:DNA polymerase type B, organellar and viral